MLSLHDKSEFIKDMFYMWIYDNISREEFELKKDFIESIIIKLGGKQVDITLPYEQKTTSITNDVELTHISHRPTFLFNDLYYRVDEVLFSKPFIVIEIGDYDMLINNTMEDTEPFPYDLSDEEFENEVKYSLEILPYPDN